MTHLVPHIVAVIEAFNENDGVDVSTLKSGTKIIARTCNSKYTMQILENGNVEVQGGSYFPEKTIAVFSGSTWGSSMIKNDWVVRGMHLEFHYMVGNKWSSITTTPVKSIDVAFEGITFLLPEAAQACAS